MGKIEIDYQNYDIAIKEIFRYFENRTLDFLGIKIPRIKQYLNIEFAEIKTSEERLDLVFMLEDDTILHLEEEADVSKKDLLRFAEYDIKLYREYGKQIRTVIITMKKINGKKSIECGPLSYNPEIINIKGDKTAEERLGEIKKALHEKREIDEAELAFLPLMKSNKPKVEILREGIEILKEIDLEKEIMYKIASIMIVLSDKFVPKNELEKIWEGLKMLKIFQIAEEKGKEEGKKEGLKEGINKGLKEGLKEGIKDLLEMKFGEKELELFEKIQKIDEIDLLEKIRNSIKVGKDIKTIKKMVG